MKKIISMLAAVAMLSSMFVTSVSAATVTVETSTPESITIEEYNAAVEGSLSADEYDAYKVAVTLNNIGTITSEVSGRTGQEKYTGRQLVLFDYKMTFDNISAMDKTDYAIGMDSAICTGAWSLDGAPTFISTFSGAYPNTKKNGEADQTDTFKNVYVYYLAIKKGQVANASITAEVGFQDYTNSNPTSGSSVEGYSPVNGNITITPASFTIGEAGGNDEYDFSAGTKHEYADGIVWAGASMTNFDTTANEYWAEFTADGVTEPRKTLIKNLPESEESITFDAVMWFAGEAKTGVTFDINEYAIAE